MQVEESAKKTVEGASNGSAILKLYNKWHDKVFSSGSMDSVERSPSKKGFLSKVKAHYGKDKNRVRSVWERRLILAAAVCGVEYFCQGM